MTGRAGRGRILDCDVSEDVSAVVADGMYSLVPPSDSSGESVVSEIGENMVGVEVGDTVEDSKEGKLVDNAVGVAVGKAVGVVIGEVV